jgi:hypothetical protein
MSVLATSVLLKITYWGWKYSSLVEHLLSMYEAPGLSPKTAKKKKKSPLFFKICVTLLVVYKNSLHIINYVSFGSVVQFAHYLPFFFSFSTGD